MGKPASLLRFQSRVPDAPSNPRDRDDPAINAHLEPYIQAFMGTEQEFSPEWEALGIESLLNAKSSEKSK
jgi:hypothetical protein